MTDNNALAQERIYQLGDKVRKKSGSSWRGTVVGFYENEPHTSEGYAVASDFEPGNVQVYPARALEPWDGTPAPAGEVGSRIAHVDGCEHSHAPIKLCDCPVTLERLAGPVQEECDVCHGSGKNGCSQLWPDYPPPCAYCKGTGRLSQPVQQAGGDQVRRVKRAMRAWAKHGPDARGDYWVIDHGKRVKSFKDPDDAADYALELNAIAALAAMQPASDGEAFMWKVPGPPPGLTEVELIEWGSNGDPDWIHRCVEVIKNDPNYVETEIDWEVWQDEMMVASSNSEAEARHYLAMYAQDGPAKLVLTERRTVTTTPLDTKEG